VLFFLIDSSGGIARSQLEEVIPKLPEVFEGYDDAQIKIAVLEFSSGARWITAGGPLEVEQFRWNFINAGGVTDFGAACKALNEKLSTKAFMNEATGSFAPAVFLLSDGEPTDNWKQDLDALKQNHWFKAAVKVAVAIGDDANKDMLKEFTGSMEAVLETHSAAMLKKMIKFVSVRASQVASKSSNVSDPAVDLGDEQKQVELNTALQEFTDDNDQIDW
jgi:uncharacterized protein YegL